MAASTLPAPGTKYGPCEEACQHRDCAEMRAMAVSECPYCSKPIGYGTRYYRNTAGAQHPWVHADCLEDAAEAAR